MAVRRILLLGDPDLRKVSLPVETTEGEAVRALLGDLRDTLHAFRLEHGYGRAISAVQIGRPVRVVYAELDGHAYALVNPECVWKSEETFEVWDDCFSFPPLLVRLRRHCRVRIRFLDGSLQVRTIEAVGSGAELLQHEMDHLDGILAVDRAAGARQLCLREEWVRRGEMTPSASGGIRWLQPDDTQAE